jgi:hypothetical protein
MRVINFQEMLHSNVGRHAAQEEYENLLANPTSKLARYRLTTLGLDPNQLLQRGLTPEDLLHAGNKMTRIVLGGRNVLDLPPVWRNSTAGRLLTMFKPFFFNQTKFLKDYVIKPALKGKDFRPLIYAAVMYPTLGEAIADLKYFVRGKGLDDRPDWDQFPADRIIDNIAQVGGFGITADIMDALNSGTPTTTYRFLTGPVVGDIVDLKRMLSGGSESLERGLLRRIPGVGPALSEWLAPPKKEYKTPLQKGWVTKKIEKVEDLVQ